MITIHENVNFTDRTSGTWLPDCSKLAINQKNNNAINLATKYHHQFLAINQKNNNAINLATKYHHQFFFMLPCVSLVKSSYWSSFHVIIVNGYRVMIIVLYNGFT